MKLVSLLSLPTLALRAPELALRTAATALGVLAKVNEQLAETLTANGDTPAQAGDDQLLRPALSAVPDAPPSAPPAAPAPLPPPVSEVVEATAGSTATPREADAPQDVTVAPGAAALAAKTVPQVLTALDSLSDVELADLYEYESRHRRRRTILQAIEAAAAPPPDAAATDADEIILDDDLREPDELVYSTETPRG